MATKKTWEWARRVSLTAYRKALALAEDGNWTSARGLVEVGTNCAFCQAQADDFSPPRLGRRGGRNLCPTCPALRLCNQVPHGVPQDVLEGGRTRADGLKRLRSTIAQLEALDV